MTECPPRYSSAITPGAPNDLAQVKAVSYLMQRRRPDGQLAPAAFYPHQEHIARVLSERGDSGRWRYPTAVLTAPRRIGKSVVLDALMVARSIMHDGHQSYFTMQTADDAWSALTKLAKVLEDSPALYPRIESIRYAHGGAAINFRNGSKIGTFTPSEKALDSNDADFVVIDEAFALKESTGSLLMQSVAPTLLNRPRGQLVILSAAGHAGSTWFKTWVDKGRAASSDPKSDLGFIEWSMNPEADPNDVNEWLKFHPGYAYGLTDLAGMKAARSRCTTQDEWLRSYCNLWQSGQGKDPIVDLNMWDGLVVDDVPTPTADKMFFAFDVAADDSAASIAAAWKLDDGTPYGEIVHRAPGSAWLSQALDELGARKYLADATGATLPAIQKLPNKLARKVKPVSTRDFMAACQTVISRTRTGDIAHAGQASLRDALAVAAPTLSRGMTGFSADRSPAPIDAARAFAIAIGATMTRPKAPLVI